MANNWRNDDERRDHRMDRDARDTQSGQDYRADSSSFGRGRDEESRDQQGRGADYARESVRFGDQSRSAGGRSGYGSASGAGDNRSYEDGNRGRFSDYGSPSRDYGRGPYEGHGFDSERRFGAGSHDPYRAWQEDGNRSGRNDWGRQEWGMSGPQQGGYGAERPSFRDQNYARDRDRGYGQDRGQERGLWDRATDEVSSWFGDEEAERRRLQDQHRGRGPKNYSRSDDRVREDVSDRLTDDWQVDASEIELSVSKGEVTLTGTVNDRMQRRRAEDVVERVSGVTHVQNNLRVRGSGTTPGASGAISGTGKVEGTPTAVTAGQSSTISSRNT